MSSETISFKDVLGYWSTFFPEKKHSLKEIEEVIKSVTKKDFNHLKPSWEAQEKNQKSFQTDVQEILNCTANEMVEKVIIGLNHLEYSGFIFPFIRYHLSEKFYEIEKNSEIIDSKKGIESIVINTYNSLYKIFYKTMVLEINLAREQSLLQGDCPESRFDYFNNVLLKSKEFLIYLYSDYLEMFNLLNKRTKDIINFIISIISHTNRYAKYLKTVFNINFEKIEHINAGGGDSHCGAKSVSIILFDTGDKLVYKPRNMDLEQNFNRFIDWINSLKIPGFLNLSTAKVYSASSFGWMEYVQHNELKREEDASKYYSRIGQLLSLLYIFNSKDFHHENIIANGENPILIDLETLFHGDLKKETYGLSAQEISEKLIDESVCSIYLLPNRVVFSKANNAGFLDVGGLSGGNVQKATVKTSTIQNQSTDQVRIVRDYGFITPEKNLPLYDKRVQNASDHVQTIKQSFNLFYNWIRENKELLILNITKFFKEGQCRLIIKPTHLYSSLLNSSFHPDLIQTPLHREIFLTRIGLSKFEEYHEHFFSNEYNDLKKGDIPYFYMDLNSRFVKNSYGEKVTGITLKKSPIEDVKMKINMLNSEDLKKQLNFIELSFLYSEFEDDKAMTDIVFNQTSENLKRNVNIELMLAKQIGDYLITEAVEGVNDNNKEMTWLGVMVYGKEESLTEVSGVGSDLYKGNSGIAMFFSYLYKSTNEYKYKEAAIKSLNYVAAYINGLLELKDNDLNFELNFGGFSGIGGMLYALYHSGVQLKEEQFIELAIQGTEIIKKYSEDIQSEDIIAGITGAISAILSIYKDTKISNVRQKLYEVLKTLYFRLLEIVNVKTIDDEPEWNKVAEGYTGYAHGSSGISGSLIQLYSVFKDELILHLITSSLKFERHLYSDEQKNWYIQSSKNNLSNGWCHGAPGILLNRMILKANGYHDESIDTEIEIAIKTTIKNGFGNNLTLCHGDFGNLLILDFTADVLADSVLKKYCENTYVQMLDEIKRIIDNPRDPNKYLLGLMIGLSGYGYFILKKLNSNVKNIMFLE
ncbi:type 2 lanthipeptide synthetase LanM family protein [Bacillus inaquosorum]|uniref:type 2 lanthipeptide synthetase LanM family protein n=1 Tax=Bacillus inaquosorum TaxID=483913 RepID=UPI0034CD1551